MTTVYGVTFIGARKQIYKKLAENKNFDTEFCNKAAIYITKLTFKSLGEVFKNAYNIMEWLNQCAKLISKENCPVRWNSPLGLPIVQPYNSKKKKAIKTILQSINLTVDNENLDINKSKQKSAFPPNFVHGLDASHMFLTCIECKENNIEFASVHDSFWTHACDVSNILLKYIDKLSVIIREKFIELHSKPILENLIEDFKSFHPNIQFPNIPDKGDLDLTNVKDSLYFFD
jgi:DNA-directed RNA polymerase